MYPQLFSKHAARLNTRLLQQLWAWLHTAEGALVCATLLGHALLHLALPLFMPLPYFSELSAHDGRSYYALAYDPVPAQPAYSLMRYKRVLFALAARAAWPWDAHIGFALIGIAAAAMANLFVYRILARYTQQPLRPALLFACSPYLFAAAHLALPDPVSVALTLAALYALLEGRFGRLVIYSALALLFKEVAATAVLALAVLAYGRWGWRRAATYLALCGLPVLGLVAVYAQAWGQWQWYLLESRSTIVPAPITLVRLIASAASPAIVRLDSAINLGILALLAWALWRLRSIDRRLLVYSLIVVVPLLFLDERQYQSDFDMARQYMAVAPALLAFAGPANRAGRWLFQALLAGMIAYGMYYILSISTFFVTYKHEILSMLTLFW